MIPSYERSEIFRENFGTFEAEIKAQEREYIEDFKKNKVRPLVERMKKCNLDLYYQLEQKYPDPDSFKLTKMSMEIKAGISGQKHDYQVLLNELRELGDNFYTGVEMQRGMFESCKILLDAAIEYDFPEQAIETIKLMQDSTIVGKNSDFVAVEALKGISRSYIKRYINESTEAMERIDLKTSIRNLVNDALVGKYGDIKAMTEENLTPKEFASIFKGIFREAVDNSSKVTGKKGA